MYIYVIKNKINGKRYVGKTVKTVNHRFKKHIWESLNEQSETYHFVFHKALRKYGVDNFEFEQIIDCRKHIKTAEELSEIEKQAIKFYKSYTGWKDSHGYNSTMGGEGYNVIGIRLDVYDKEGNFHGTYDSIEQAARETGAQATNISAILNNRSTGKTCNGFIFVKHGESNPGFINECYKKVDIYDLNKKFITTCDTVKEAAEFLNSHISHVSASCLNKQYLCAGHLCVFHGEDIAKKEIKKIDGIDIYDAKTKQYIKTLPNVTQVANELGFSRGKIKHCVISDNHLAGDYLVYRHGSKIE